MLNQIVIVGRLVQDPEIKELEYETDFIPVRLYKGIAENTVDYCKIGDMVGIRGRVQSRKEEDKSIIEIVAERVTFLSSRKEKEEE